MLPTKIIASALMCAASWLSTTAQVPDSVYIFSYAESGKSGLRLAVSDNGVNWTSLGDGMNFVTSDFGSWGGSATSKKMYSPRLYFSNGDKKWHAIWQVTPSGGTYAHAVSNNLIDWRPQTFFRESDMSKYRPTSYRKVDSREAYIDGKAQYGSVQKISKAEADYINKRIAERKAADARHGEQAKDDPTRFAGLKDVNATIDITDNSKAISDKLIGIFFEDINYAADGGLYAELVRNRDFEFSSNDRNGWNPTTGWTIEGAELTIDTVAPIHPNNPHYAAIDASTGAVELVNNGFDGIKLTKGEGYNFSIFGRTKGSTPGSINVSLVAPDGATAANATVKIASKEWRKYEVSMKSLINADSARLTVKIPANARVDLDMVSLFPQNTFKNRRNGLRKDLAQTLADLKPRFVRFPGGCVAHGQGIDNIYDWKGSVGPLEARKPLSNLWGYHQTRGLGYHEYFQFCEDINAEPLPVLAAGVPCQNSNHAAHHTHDELTLFGQQDGIPMEEMDAYVQDVLDLIEYANGDAKSTEWGRKRAEAGHPKPFDLKYIGIGNEDLISPAFKVRFKMINDAVREKYPDITVVGTVGPFYEGADYIEGWEFAREENVPMVDEHYYVSPGWMIHNQHYYDNYDRKGPKVYLGEYAAHLPGRPSNIETALAEALYLTSVERNADVVEMTSYAPLLAKDRNTQWTPDLIYFSNNDVRPTVDYYVQKLYGNNSGNRYVDSKVTLDNNDDAVSKRIGVSVVTDDKSGDMIIKLVNMLPVNVNTTVNLPYSAKSATVTRLSGSPVDKDVKPVTSTLKVNGSAIPTTLPKYSMTVIRLKNGK